MKSLVAVFVFVCLGAICLAGASTSKSLARSTPEEQGVLSSGILAFVEAADQQIDTMNSFILVRHGKVVAEGWWSPYESKSPHVLYSLSKSFTSTAVGLAVSEGKLSIDDEVLKFFPEDAPAEPSKNLKEMRVRDLLCMSTGHQTEPPRGDSEAWTRTFLAHPVPHKPGTHFLYNTSATYMLSAIVQKVTGVTVLEYLRPRLFEPLGIENPTWGTSPQGVSLGGYGLNITTEDIARFGQLYLQKGEWKGKRLVPASWIEAATARQTSNGSNPASDWDQGYGFQFWRCRNGIYRGDGAFGQYCIVMPEQDAVVAITSGVRDMQAVLNLVWDKLLPAMKSAPLPSDRAAHNRLVDKLKKVEVRTVSGSPASALAGSVSGKQYVFPSNGRHIQSVALDFGPDSATLVIGTGDGEKRIACGAGRWIKGRTSFADGPDRRALESTDHPVAASGAWTADDTYSVKLCSYETPFYVTLSFKFRGDQLLFDSEYNVAFGPTKLPQLVGQAVNRGVSSPAMP